MLPFVYFLQNCFCLVEGLPNVIVSHFVHDAKAMHLCAAVSNTSRCFSSTLLSVHASQLYKEIGTISDLYNLILISLFSFLFFQILSRLLITFKALATVTLMSVEQSQVAFIPRYLETV